MIEAIKRRIWDLLMEKEISLAMLFDGSGRILWHRGRAIQGRSIEDGEGFPRSSIRQVLSDGGEVAERDVVVRTGAQGLPQSARVLYLRSLLIIPVNDRVFLYLDSGAQDEFTDADCGVFRILGSLLGDTLDGLKSDSLDDGGVTGSSPAMGRVRDLLVTYAIEDDPVLLLGETGVGKSHLARLVHRWSGRRGRFVTAHVPSIPESLFEREMFGHQKGAFTDAGQGRPGLVAEASGGTLFLDEISEVPSSFQAKLLELVEGGRYRPLGESRDRESDLRIVAASNRDLAEAVGEGSFRRDLYYRLNVLPILIPPLRERPEDLRAFVEEHVHLLRGKGMGPGFWKAMGAHPWPGNVREVLQVLKRAGIQLPGGSEIGEEIDAIIGEGLTLPASGDPVRPLEAAVENGETFWTAIWAPFLHRDLNRGELRSFLLRRYRSAGHSLKRLAGELNISDQEYPRFVSALHKYGIHPGRPTSDQSSSSIVGEH